MAETLVVNDVTYPEVETISMTNENGEQVEFYPDAVRYNPQTLTEAQKMQARENIGAGTSSFAGDYNSLTNKPVLCNPNLLDNWYWVNPVNQKGQTTYTKVGGYNIDRWRVSTGTTSTSAFVTELLDGGVKITSTYNNDNAYIRQTLEKPLPAGTYTLSVLAEDVSDNLWFYFSASNGNAITNNSGVYVANGLASVTRTFTDGQVEAIWMKVPPKGYVKIKAIKLEVGSVQTLAHQENGEWVLNEIPNYGEELRKCQRHMFVIKAPGNSYVIGSGVTLTENRARFLVPTPVTMRVTPVIKVEGEWSITNGSTYQSLRDHTDEAPALTLVGVTENGAHLLAYANSTVSSGLPVLLRGNDASAMLIFDANL